MSSPRLAVLICAIGLCSACAEPPTASGHRSSGGGTVIPAAQLLHGVLAVSGKDSQRFVLQQEDRLIPLVYDDRASLEGLIGESVILSGSYMSDGRFRVVGARKAVEEEAFARR